MAVICVCGGRKYDNWAKVFATLDEICYERGWIHEPDDFGNFLPNVTIIQGECPSGGADKLAKDWAAMNLCESIGFPPHSDLPFAAACKERNQDMADYPPDILIAFPGGKGTADMIKRARFAGVEVIEVK